MIIYGLRKSEKEAYLAGSQSEPWGFSKREVEWSELCLQQTGNGWKGHH